MKVKDNKYIIGTKKFVYGRKEYEYPVYDTSTPEGWHSWVDATYGSIDDEASK